MQDVDRLDDYTNLDIEEQGGQDQKTSSNKRGFASMDPEQQRRIASKGGRAAHKAGSAHEWTSAEASEAGRKGGQN